MNTIRISNNRAQLHIEVSMPNNQFAFLKYGTTSNPLSEYLPIKVLPLDQDGYGKYELPCENMIPEAATHIWVRKKRAVFYLEGLWAKLALSK